MSNCQKPYLEEEYNCPVCGYSPSEENTTVVQPEVPSESSAGSIKKPLSKNPLFWLGGCTASTVIFIFLILIGIFVFRTLNPASNYEEEMKNTWTVIRTKSESLIDKSEISKAFFG